MDKHERPITEEEANAAAGAFLAGIAAGKYVGPAPQDLYLWSVTYTDGDTMHEYDIPEGRAWADIGEKAMQYLDLEPNFENIPAQRVLIPEGAEPVFFRRRQLVLGEADNEIGRSVVHCIGWKQQEQGVYLFVFADGSTLLTDDFQAV